MDRSSPPALLLLPLAAACAVAGCGWRDAVDSRSATAGLPTLAQDLEAHDWVLDAAASSIDLGADARVTIGFEDDEVTGAAPCNRYRGTADIDGDETIRIDHLVTTLQACDEAIMRAEDRYLAALTAVDTAKTEDDGDRLVLRNDVGDRLTYNAHDPDS